MSMFSLALKRLASRPALTILSIAGVALAIGLAVGIPNFSRLVSFIMLKEELDLNARAWRSPFAMRIYVLPAGRYPLTLEACERLDRQLAEAVTSRVGLPLASLSRYMETTWVALRTRAAETAYGPPHTSLASDLNLVLLPGVASRMAIVDGEPIDEQSPAEDELDVWMHQDLADGMGIRVGEQLEVQELRYGARLDVRIAGIWRAADPQDAFWFGNPDLDLRKKLLVRAQDYRAVVEPAFQAQLDQVYWYLALDHTRLNPDRMRAYADGLNDGVATVSQYLPDAVVDGLPLRALQEAMARESRLAAFLFVLNVPVVGFLLSFLGLISAIAVRRQGRERAMMSSRGMDRAQLALISLAEALAIVGAGLPLGFLVSAPLARSMGHVHSFLSFTWQEPTPAYARVQVTSLIWNAPMLVAVASAALLARLWPALRPSDAVVAHERARSRAQGKPLWQRLYLDVLLFLPSYYAYRRLQAERTLVPIRSSDFSRFLEVLPQESSLASLGCFDPQGLASQDPLLFLAPALFVLACSLLLVRLFPLCMRLGDWLGALGRRPTFYLAFRQLSRQGDGRMGSGHTHVLLLIAVALGLGAFMASMALSLDRWLAERIYYQIGADVLIEQTPNPDQRAGGSPIEGAWILPASSYLGLPGVVAAARVGMYPAAIVGGDGRSLPGTFIGIDRLDTPDVLFFRPDFGDLSLGMLMNRLAQRADAVLISEKLFQEGNYELGDKVRVNVGVAGVPLETEVTIAGTYAYFPTVYELADRRTALVGNLEFLFDQVGATLLHNVWLATTPHADQAASEADELIAGVERLGVHIGRWRDARARILQEQAMGERVGVFGTLTIGFLAATALSGTGLLVYNHAALQERLFHLAILRAVGLSAAQVVGQVIVEYVTLILYGLTGGVLVGVWASRLFIPFFQTTDRRILEPPTLIPLVAWGDIARISIAFAAVLIVVQVVVIAAALRRRAFQALRLGDQE